MDETKYQTRTLKVAFGPEGASLYAEEITNIEIVDVGAGELIEISQCPDAEQKILIDPQEWPALREAIDKMVDGVFVKEQ